MDAEFDLENDGTVTPAKPTRGGKRANAGRKPAGYVKPAEVVDFERARARNEAAKAKRNELDFLVESKQYVSREAVQQVVATVMLSLSQTLQSIPDTLETEGIDAQTCQKIEKVIHETLAAASQELELMSGVGSDDEGNE